MFPTFAEHLSRGVDPLLSESTEKDFAVGRYHVHVSDGSQQVTFPALFSLSAVSRACVCLYRWVNHVAYRPHWPLSVFCALCNLQATLALGIQLLPRKAVTLLPLCPWRSEASPLGALSQWDVLQSTSLGLSSPGLCALIGLHLQSLSGLLHYPFISPLLPLIVINNHVGSAGVLTAASCLFFLSVLILPAYLG